MFADAKTILFLKRKSLLLYNQERSLVQSFSFKDDLVYHQEIINFEEFKKQLKEFLTGMKLSKQRVLLLLGDDVVFKKTFPLDMQSGLLASETAKFFNEIPFNVEVLVKKIYRLKDNVMALAINGKFYMAISEVVKELGWFLEAVVPMAVLSGIGGGEALSEQDIRMISINEKVIIKAGLIEQQQPPEADEIKRIGILNLNKGTLILATILVLVVIVAAFVIGREVFVKEPNRPPKVSSENGAVNVLTASPSAQPSPPLELISDEATPSTQGGQL